MTPADLSHALSEAVRSAVAAGELRVAVPERIVVERARPGGAGSYASNVALRLAGPAGQPPEAVARVLRRRVLGLRVPGVADVEVTGPGFLSFTLDGDGRAALVREILARGAAAYGHLPAPRAVPSASAPRTLHFPDEPRAAVVADAVRRVLLSQGVPVRLGCAAEAEPGWVGYLGVRVDAYGVPEGAAGRTVVRPVPAPRGFDPNALGRDAARWALLRPPAHERPRLGTEEGPGLVPLLAQREGNPLFRVRYAHARSRALVRNARDLGFAAEAGELYENRRPEQPEDPGTRAADRLLGALAAYPALLSALTTDYAPDRLCRHLVVTADAFFRFHDAIRVLPLGPEKPSAAHRARLALAEAAGTVLAGGLSLLGIDAPEHL
ncbi:ArgS-related anticodon-binding protein NrtL [Streptomyces physcomitrii]|uniref:arginine--tRNA ligase n=1 Tax=Streptomyces physcomitrii TaxID=2724184 RepID=A0ABX1GVX3_9ACTN|nr:DALR anticodon-binding domain-containing protein [Streptomyces physcomitrii]NKI40236.1 hypothetical protein [Streptomyces physcomitrii]